MSNPNTPSGDEKDVSTEVKVAPETVVPNPSGDQAPAKEAVEAVPELKLVAASSCKNPDGRYVGLSKVQRDKLGVEVGGNVELFDAAGKSLGLFSVGTGSKELLKEEAKFTVNGVAAGEAVTARKASEKQESDMAFAVTHGVESTPAGLDDAAKQKYEDRLASRASKIAERFPELDSKAYVVVPTAVAKSMGVEGPKGSTVLPISKGKIKLGDVVTEIAIVPSGNNIGFTTEAAKSIGIPDQIKELRVRVVDGVLVIA